jgi:hypothetical protein
MAAISSIRSSSSRFSLSRHHCGVPDWNRSIIIDTVFARGRILFGILIWKEWHCSLMEFIEHNALDDRLPLDEARAKVVAATFGSDFAQHAQWEFLPRSLTKETSGHHHRLRKEEILPFTDAVELGRGPFSIVHRMAVVPSLQTIFPHQVC